MTTTLALDPATRCGFAVAVNDEVADSGVWNLKPKGDTRPGQRGLRLFEYLHDVWRNYEPGRCYFEDVQFASTTYAAHVFGGLKMVIEVWCEMHKIGYEGIGVGTIKKIATGRGNASKEDMVARARLLWPDIHILDDNHADALLILEAGNEIYRLRNRQTDLFTEKKGKR